MSGRTSSSQAGFTLIEILISVAIASLAVIAGVETFATADLLATESRLQLRATAAYRDAQAAIGASLRNADIDTLGGFDSTGRATEPSFRPVVGILGEVVQHGPERVLAYRDYSGVLRDVPGLGDVEVGDIVMRMAGEPDEVLARNAVRGSFQVRQEGRSLVIGLATLHGTGRTSMKRVGGETVVSLRN